MNIDTITIKFKAGQENRRLSLEGKTMDSLFALINETFPDKTFAHLYYFDDTDQITVKTEKELLEMFKFFAEQDNTIPTIYLGETIKFVEDSGFNYSTVSTKQTGFKLSGILKTPGKLFGKKATSSKSASLKTPGKLFGSSAILNEIIMYTGKSPKNQINHNHFADLAVQFT
jgi:hypothetical protein